jgi:hypothetical protein
MTSPAIAAIGGSGATRVGAARGFRREPGLRLRARASVSAGASRTPAVDEDHSYGPS